MNNIRQIDDPNINDNRKYDYSNHHDSERSEYPIIVDMVKPNSRVIDLGCGNGTLLAMLKKEKNIVDCGLEISETGVAVCKERGLNVSFGRIDERLPFDDNAFDYAICNVTIQMVMYPEILLKEMKRVSKYQIVSFPNFAFWKNRFDLLLNGRMPRPMMFNYSWYGTGHIHQLSFRDFSQLVDDIGGLRIVERRFTEPNDPIRKIIASMFPDLFHLLGIYLLEKQ
ncbi:MAG TPA: methionine biosynthesis protein MetW [Bacteroidetes bacterium]|nr:methionine biosynthesis protein MetW [Bacteroidota bacterium]